MKPSSLIDLVRDRANERPDQMAYTYLEDGLIEAQRISYAGLYERSAAVAAELQAISKPGDRALLLFPAGLDFLGGFFGTIFAGVIGIPTPPPEASRLKRTGPRLRSIVEDAAATMVVTTSKIRAMIESADSPIFEGHEIRWLTVDDVDIASASKWREPTLPLDPLAYLQYTSGSTSTPKGVMIGHENVLFHLAQLQKNCGYAADSVTVTWMPNFHDYGLVEGLLEPLYNATPCYLMSPLAFVKRPLAWLKAITKYKGTHSQAPNFAYDHCVRRIAPDQREGLNLSSWKAAGNAAELIHPRVVDEFIAAFEPHGFRRTTMCPAFGLAEATLLVSSSPTDQGPKIARLQANELEQHRVVDALADDPTVRNIVGCGKVFSSTRVAIVDPETLIECSPHEVGEIWVNDRAVAQGYWQRPEESEQIFRATISGTKEGPFLRTGDLGFLKDGELFIAGRIKDVIIIRGTNHHPQDIEWTVQATNTALRPENGAAFSVVVDGEERLVVAQEVEREHQGSVNFDDLTRVVRQAVAESHDLDLYALILLTRGSIPKTASGKIQRQACRPYFHDGGSQVLATWRANAPKAAQPTVVPTPLPTAPTVKKAFENAFASAEVSKQRADDLIMWLREYSSERINSRLMDERRCIPPYILLDFGNRGIMGMQVAERYGGLALRYVDTMRVLEQLGAIDLTLAAVVFLNSTNGVVPIQRHAKAALRDELLPRLAAGRELASFALSEPGAGANLGGVVGQARPDGKGGWRIHAYKRWNSASWAGIVSVFVRLVDERGRLGGLTGFVVRQGTPGLRVGPEALTMGLRASIQNSLSFDGVAVGPDQVLGELGKGMEVAEDALTIGRLCIGAACLGTMKRCAQLMGRYGDRRMVASGRLGENPAAISVMSDLTALISTIEALKDQIAERLDDGQFVPAEAPMAVKILVTDSLNWAAGQLMQLLGGRGYMENNIAPQILRDARALSVGEGPNEPLTVQIGRAARHTENIRTYLDASGDSSDIANTIATISTEVAERCKQTPTFGGSITSVQLWTDWLIGQVALDGLLLSATRESHRRNPAKTSKRALLWAELRFARTLQRARKGQPEEKLLAAYGEIASQVDHYIGSIGDIEQSLPGEEDQLDPFLWKTEGVAPKATRYDLPGQSPSLRENITNLSAETAKPTTTTVSVEEESLASKRERLAKLLKSRIEPTNSENS